MIGRATTPDAENKDLRVWALAAAYFAIAATAFALAGFFISLATGIAMAGLTGVGSVISVAAIRVMPQSRVLRIVSGIHQQLIYGLASAMLSYGAAMAHRPLADATLLAADRALGYDWRAYMVFVVAHPALSRLLSSAYDTLFWQMFIITVVAGLDRDRRVLQQYVTANILVLLIAIGLFALWPVTTAWVYLGIDADTLRSLHLVQGGWPQQLIALRAGTVHEVTPMLNFAIVGFPSYHCAAGLINVWAAWRYRWLRWPMTGVAVTMIASTPIGGGHYIVDLIGAAMVTVVGIRLAGAFLAAPSPTMPWPGVRDWRGRAAVT